MDEEIEIVDDIGEENKPKEEVVEPTNIGVDSQDTTANSNNETITSAPVEPVVEPQSVFDAPVEITNDNVVADPAPVEEVTAPVEIQNDNTAAVEPQSVFDAPVETTNDTATSETTSVAEPTPIETTNDNVATEPVVEQQTEVAPVENITSEPTPVEEVQPTVEPQNELNVPFEPVNTETPVAEPIQAPTEEPVSVPTETSPTEPAPVEEIAAPVEVPNNTDSQSGIDIKQTSTIMNESGTQVIGSLNGDSAETISEKLPDGIDITTKEMPKQEEKKKTKRVKIQTKRDKISNIISIILIILVLAGGGFGAYFFLYLQNDNLFEVKNVTYELGTTLPVSATYYVETSKKIDDMTYEVDLSNVQNTVGVYNYTVKHNEVTKSGIITIEDTKGPVVTLNENLKFSINTVVTKNDIVDSCEDPSTCTYELSETIDTTKTGKQEITVVAKDSLGNESSTPATIEIFEVSKTLVCSSTKSSADGKTEEIIEDTLYFDNTDKFIYVQSKKITKFIDFIAYFQAFNEYKDNKDYTFDAITHSYSQANKSIYKDQGTTEQAKNFYSANSYTCE